MKKLMNSWVIVGLLAAAPVMTGCADRTEAPDYAERVNDSLETANLDDIRADWKNDERTLHLTGEVRAAADRARAEQLAKQVVGTSGTVVNEVKVEGAETAGMGDVGDRGNRDDRIEEQLNRMFEDRTEWDFDGRGVNFDVNAGVVTVTGNVESAALKEKIAARARQIEGVKDVVNNLEVEPRRKR